MEELSKVYLYLKTLADLEPADLAPFVGKYARETVPAKTVIFSEGDPYRKVAFLLRGLVKKFYLTESGQEFIKEFTWEGQITTPYASLLRNQPATYTMVALEETELLTIDYGRIEELIENRPKWMAIAKALADFHFLNREDREMELLKYSAPERYSIFKRRFPHLLGRIKKQDIAGYLGITPVSLSRLESAGSRPN
jgi:CRP-like cAMP-binding protein